MKIQKFVKLKSNKYSIEIEDGDRIKLYDDVIVKYNLLVNKEMDLETFDEIIEYNSRLDAYYKSLRYLTKKLRTEKEIFKYLEKEFEKDIIFETIERLKSSGYLNNDIYLKCYFNDQINLGNSGPNKIKDELINLGFKDEDFKDILDNIDDSVWLSKLEKLIEKKVKTNHQYGIYKLKEKIIYDMSNLGYYKWMIEEVISKMDLSCDENLLEKEYRKCHIKLSKKLDGNELEYQIRCKLLNKGFSYDEVNNFMDKKKNF